MTTSRHGATSTRHGVLPWVALGAVAAVALGAAVVATLARGTTSDVVLVLVGGLALTALVAALLLPVLAPVPGSVVRREWGALPGRGSRHGSGGWAGGAAHVGVGGGDCGGGSGDGGGSC